MFIDKTLSCSERSLDDSIAEVRRINDPDVDVYAWIVNQYRWCAGIAWLGAACDNIDLKKSSISAGPKRGVVETAEVHLI